MASTKTPSELITLYVYFWYLLLYQNLMGFIISRQQDACTTFEEMSKTAKSELKLQKERRVAHFQKSLAEMAELEVKHAKAHAQMLRQTIQAIKAEN